MGFADILFEIKKLLENDTWEKTKEEIEYKALIELIATILMIEWNPVIPKDTERNFNDFFNTLYEGCLSRRIVWKKVLLKDFKGEAGKNFLKAFEEDKRKLKEFKESKPK